MKRKIKKCIGIGVICFSAFFCFAIDGIAKDPDYPTRPIEFIITYGAGGTTDLSCRGLCEAASKHLPQPVIPINKIGASGVTGTALIKNAKPDGYTIGVFTQSPAFIIPFVQETPYDTLKDFTPIMHFGEYIYPLLVREDKPWKTWKELVEWARKNPRQIKVGTTGSKYTQVQGIALSRIELKENIKFTYIPFKSGPETLTALLGGTIDLYGSTVDTTTIDYLNMGKVRMLSFLSKSKLPGYEKLPNTDEIYGISVCNLIGVAGPKGLPPYVTKKLEEVLKKAIADPSFINLMKKMDTAIVYMTGEEMGKYIEKTYQEQGEIIKRLKEEEAKK
jgi:tripartite-type tricarboxylate transporter receptor subunit TctC